MRLKKNNFSWLFLVVLVVLGVLGVFVVGVWNVLFVNFNTADINLYGVEIAEVKATPFEAYFLSESGDLYSTGANSDAGAFVKYQDKTRGLVARNVKKFDTMTGGGYYIDYSNNLYVWNMSKLPLYNYVKTRQHYKLMSGVKFAELQSERMIYIDSNDNLYLIGEFYGEKYIFDEPRLLGKNVSFADISGSMVVWSSFDGGIHCFGDNRNELLSLINEESDEIVDAIYYIDGSVVLLKHGELWFYGDYNSFLNIDTKSTGTVELKLLANNIVSMCYCGSSIIALSEDNVAYVWGRCLSDSSEEAGKERYSYYEALRLAENVKSVYISDLSICYANLDGETFIYHEGGFESFFGNSSKSKNVGIDNEPVTWIG